jgi:hypothetical protein
MPNPTNFLSTWILTPGIQWCRLAVILLPMHWVRVILTSLVLIRKALPWVETNLWRRTSALTWFLIPVSRCKMVVQRIGVQMKWWRIVKSAILGSMSSEGSIIVVSAEMFVVIPVAMLRNTYRATKMSKFVFVHIVISKIQSLRKRWPMRKRIWWWVRLQ